jgi:predicted metalloenzyme YecM
MSRKRSPNFTESELQTLLNEVERHKSISFSKLSNVITNSAKKKVWDTICSKINAANQTDHRRTVEETVTDVIYCTQMQLKQIVFFFFQQNLNKEYNFVFE